MLVNVLFASWMSVGGCIAVKASSVSCVNLVCHGGDVRGRWLLVCVVWYSSRGVCVEHYVVGVGECFVCVYITCDY